MKAFPNNEKYTTETNGMDLRDYFAAKAMNGYLSKMASNPLETGPICVDMETETNMDAVAKAAYLFADAMMKAREQ
jgi:hypothetical protein